MWQPFNGLEVQHISSVGRFASRIYLHRYRCSALGGCSLVLVYSLVSRPEARGPRPEARGSTLVRVEVLVQSLLPIRE